MSKTFWTEESKPGPGKAYEDLETQLAFGPQRRGARMLSKGHDFAPIRRVLLSQIGQLADDLREIDPRNAVHEAHRRCKRIRAIIKLLRPVSEVFYQRENKTLRNLARSLSDVRDGDVVSETFARAIKGKRTISNRFPSLLNALEVCGEKSPALVKAKIARNLKTVARAKARFDDFNFSGDKSVPLIARGIRQSYKRGRKAMVRAHHCDKESDFHEWRKRVKELDYQMQLLPRQSGVILLDWKRKLGELGHVLGQKHDLLILRTTLRNNSKKITSTGHLARYLEILAAGNFRLTAKAQKLGRHLYSLKPAAFGRRLGLLPEET